MSVTAQGAARKLAQDAQPDASAPIRRSRSRVLLVVVIVLLIIPFAVLFARAVFGSWDSVSDHASIELRTRAVGTADTPLVGPYSRYGWNHPGPLLFYVLTLPYRVLGSESTGILAGAVLVNAAAIACSVWMLWRRGRVLGLALGLLPVALLVHASGGVFLEDPWNPYIVVFAILALALLAWSVACGDHWMLPIAIAFASFAIQTHVGTALPSLTLVVLAFAFVAVDARQGRVRRLAALGALTGGVTLLLWLPAFIDQFRPNGGNLAELWRFWTSEQAPGPGFVNAARLVAPQLGAAPSFITGHESRNMYTGSLDPGWTVPVMLVLLGAATVFALRNRDRQSFGLDAVALVLGATAWLSAARIVGEPFTYLLRWTWTVGAISWLAIAWTVMRALRARSQRPSPAFVTGAAIAVAGLVLGLVAASTVSAARADPPVAAEAEVLAHLDGPLRAALAGTRGPVLVRSAGSLPAAVLASGVLVLLVHAGIPAGLDPSSGYIVGDRYVVAPGNARVELLVASEDDDLNAFASDPRNREIARYDTLTPAERRELTAFLRRTAAQGDNLGAWLRDHAAETKRARSLSARGARGAVFERLRAPAG
jgi:hypothetical protein